MRKLYLVITAMVLSLASFAQTSLRDFVGDWTFTFLDNKEGGKQVTKILNFTYENNSGEYVFIMPEGKGLLNIYNGSYNADTNTLALTFQPWGYSYVQVEGYYTNNSKILAVYEGDQTTTQRAFLDYNVTDKTISNLKFNYGSLGTRDTNSITFTGDYSGAETGSFDYTLVSMQYGVVEGGGDSNSISVSIETSMAYPSTLDEAKIFAMLNVDAKGYEDYQVWYNLYLDSQEIVHDTEITPDGGDYLIYVEGLTFERNYTLNVWATAADGYISPKIEKIIWTGSAPDIRVTATAENVTNTGADITVKTNYWDIEYGPVEFTLTATCANGPTPEEIEIEDVGSGTFHITGLTGNTEYTYTIGYSAYDQIGGTFEKANAATVKFTTLAPTIELEGINYSPIAQGATFVVNTVNAQGVAANQTVDVYFQLQGSDNPAKAELADGKYTYTFSGLEASKEYTAVIFGGIGTYGLSDFVKGTEYTESFTTGEANPEITITFPEGSYSSSVQSKYYAQITATPTIVAVNAPEYNVYYNLYMGATQYREGVEVEPTDGKYVINIQELNFSRQYKVEVYATVGDGAYTSEPASFEITTVGEPGVNITKAEAQNIGETSAEIVVEYAPEGITGETSYQVRLSATGAPEVDPVTTDKTSVTFNLTGLTPGTIYTYNVGVTATNNGSSYMDNKQVIFTTLEASQVITLEDISYTQIANGAVFTVGSLVAEGFADNTQFDVYFQLSTGGAPDKAVKIVNGGEEYYEYVFNDLDPNTPYTAIVFGGTGEYGTEGFFKGTEYTQRFVSGGASAGVGNIESEIDGNARYFTLQGVEIKHPAPGTLCIKVEGNKVTKVIVK